MRMWTRLRREVARIASEASPRPVEVTTEAELAGLPPAARRTMAFFGVRAGQPRPWSWSLGWTGRFRMARDRPWMPVEVVQYDSAHPVARIFHMKARLKGLPLLVRDTYAEGRGRMLARLAGLVTVADGRGPELDVGELVTWLNDMVLFSPAMLLGAQTRWTAVDDHAFDVAFSDAGTTVRARIHVDTAGAPVDFETTDRFLDDPDQPGHPRVRGRWSTPIEGWRKVNGAQVPTRGSARWHLNGGDFVYAELTPLPETLAWNPSWR